MIRPWRALQVRCAGAVGVVGLLAACAITPNIPDASEFAADRPKTLELRYFGATTLTLSDGTDTIVVDGFFSRPGQGQLLLSSVGLGALRTNEDLLDAGLDRIDALPVSAILVSHAHHDHVMDTARILERHPAADVLGSASALKVVRAQGPVDDASALIELDGGVTHGVGRFTITAIDASHETSWFGPGGEISDSFSVPATLREYKAGESFAFHIRHPDGAVLVVPSVDLHAGPAQLEKYPADVVLLGVGLLGLEEPAGMKRYWDAFVDTTGAKRVHLIHWDNFMQPVSPGPVRSLWFDRMGETRTQLCRFAAGNPVDPDDDVDLSLLPFFEPVRIPARHVGTPQSRFCPARG